MANPAADARQQAQTRWPGASVLARSRKGITHQHPTEPSRVMVDAFIGDVHFGPQYDQEIDTAWQPTTGAWQWEMTLNDHQTYARDVFNVGNLFEFQKAGHTLNFDPQSINWIDENTSRQQIAIKQPVTGIVDDDTLLFPAAYGSGIDFHYQNQTSRLQKLITINSSNDLPEATVNGNEIWFEAEFSMSLSSGINFWIDGVEWSRANGQRVQTANMIEVRDTTGTNVLWWLGLARATDSDGNEHVGQLEVRRQGAPSNLFICVRIPKAWIDTAVFPIHIDPTVDAQVAASGDDARENNGAVSYTAATHRNNIANYYTAARWSVAVPNGATITAAAIDVYLNHGGRDEADHDILVEDADNAAAYTSGDIASRSYQTLVDWSDGDLGLSSATWASALTTVPDISTAVAATVGRTGWSSGNYIAVALQHHTSGDLQIVMYDSDTSLAPKIHIEYTSGGAAETASMSLDVIPALTEGAVSASIASMTVPAYAGIAGGSLAQAIADMSVPVYAGITSGALAQAVAAISTDVIAISSLQPIAGTHPTLSLELVAGISDSAQAGALGAMSLLSAMGVDSSAIAGAQAGMTLDQLVGLAISTGQSVSASMDIQSYHGVTFSGLAATGGMLTLTVVPTASYSAMAGSNAAIAIDAILSVVTSTGRNVDADITISLSPSIGISAGAQCLASISMDASVSIDEVASAITDAGFTINSINQVGISTTIEVTTPSGRIYVIITDDRTFAVSADSRSLAIPAGTRIYEILED